jgi:radical SAM superfamily enzyme YgiQ (UPF0313 family)
MFFKKIWIWFIGLFLKFFPKKNRIRVLLVQPPIKRSYWGLEDAARLIAETAHAPLGLITLAPILSHEADIFEFRLVDMGFQQLRDGDIKWADAVMVTGMIVHKQSIAEILQRLHGRRPTVVGGPFASSSPHAPELRLATSIFIGEAEQTLAIRELVAGLRSPRSLKGQYGGLTSDKADLRQSPVPRFDLLKNGAYVALSIQTSRGCQHRCEFCDVWRLLGLTPRYKEPEQVAAELEAIRQTGYRGNVFVVDDNFINSPTRARGILEAMLDWQREHGHPFLFYTQADIKIANAANTALAELMVEVGFFAVFIGIETVSKEALESVGKKQNVGVDVAAAVAHLRELGMIVYAGFIVGFDTDNSGSFVLMHRFIEKCKISMAMVNMLIALPGTILYEKMRTEKRLLDESGGDSAEMPNFLPTMGFSELLSGYRSLIAELYDPEVFFARATREMSEWKQGVKRRTRLREYLAAFRSMFHQGVMAPYRREYWRFLRQFAGTGKIPRAIAVAIYYHHLHGYTHEVVLPRLDRELEKLKK